MGRGGTPGTRTVEQAVDGGKDRFARFSTDNGWHEICNLAGTRVEKCQTKLDQEVP